MALTVLDDNVDAALEVQQQADASEEKGCVPSIIGLNAANEENPGEDVRQGGGIEDAKVQDGDDETDVAILFTIKGWRMTQRLRPSECTFFPPILFTCGGDGRLLHLDGLCRCGGGQREGGAVQRGCLVHHHSSRRFVRAELRLER